MLDLNPKDKLLDVGSGDGYWTNKFSNLVEEVIGLDPTDELLTLSKNIMKKKWVLIWKSREFEIQ